MKKDVKEQEKINLGYKDEFYCFKFNKEIRLKKYNKIIEKLKCVITKSNYDTNKIILKEDFCNFLGTENYKYNLDILKKIDPNFQNRDEIDFSFLYKNRTNKDETLIESQNDYTYFINDNIYSLCYTLNQNSMYLKKAIEMFMYSWVLQPIKFIYNNKEFFISGILSVYSTGNVIIQYSIPLENTLFDNIADYNSKVKVDIYLPNYMLDKSISYEYSKFDNVEIDVAIKKYNNYIIQNLRNKIVAVSNFYNYILIDYTGIPQNFDSMSKDLCKNIYWILNSPYGHFNEREKIEYDNVSTKRYSICKYCSLFPSVVGKSVILYNKEFSDDEYLSKNFTKYDQYKIANIYVNSVIHMILLKKCEYNIIEQKQLYKYNSLQDIRKDYYEIIRTNEYLFSIMHNSYGSISKLYNYLETNLTLYLQITTIENKLTKYKDIIQIKESETKDRNNFLISVIAMIFPVIFGLDAIETVTKKIDKYYNFSTENHAIHIWQGIIILILFILVKGKIKVSYYTFILRFKNLKIFFTNLINYIKRKRLAVLISEHLYKISRKNHPK